MAVLPRIFRNFDLDVDGVGYAGRVREFTPPPLVISNEDYRAGGMDAPARVDLGMESLDASVVFGEYDSHVLAQGSLLNGARTTYVLRGALKRDGERAIPIRIAMRGAWTNIDWGTISVGSINNLTVNFNCRYFRLSINNRVLHHIDVLRMVRIINGIDEIADQRAAMGL